VKPFDKTLFGHFGNVAKSAKWLRIVSLICPNGGARVMVKKAGDLIGIHLRPHDLRRHAATYASRSGVPVEIVSKVILLHANRPTTQRYLGKTSDAEAIRWIESIYACKSKTG